MAEKRTLARPYAMAAFKQAESEAKVDDWADMMDLLASVSADPSMKSLLGDPRVLVAERIELLLDVCKGRLSKTAENFVKVLAHNGRLDLLPTINELFQQQVSEFRGVSRVEVVSAFALDAKTEDVIKNAMSKRLGRDVEVNTEVDESLIGGTVIRVGDVVIDGSVRGRLKQLRLSVG